MAKPKMIENKSVTKHRGDLSGARAMIMGKNLPAVVTFTIREQSLSYHRPHMQIAAVNHKCASVKDGGKRIESTLSWPKGIG